jgi:hypothetical protein
MKGRHKERKINERTDGGKMTTNAGKVKTERRGARKKGRLERKRNFKEETTEETTEKQENERGE